MPGEDVQPAIRRLLRETIDSIEKLEILIALVRATAPTTTAALTKALSLSPINVEEALSDLLRDGIVHHPPDDRQQIFYNASHPRAPEASALVALYEEDRARVLRLISHLALDRVRADAARLLADAFIVTRRKGKDDG